MNRCKFQTFITVITLSNWAYFMRPFVYFRRCTYSNIPLMYVPMDAREQAENLKVFSAILGLRLAGLGKIPAIKLKLLDGHDPVSCDAPMLKREEKNYHKNTTILKLILTKPGNCTCKL